MDRFYYLTGRALTGEDTPEEREELRLLLEDNPEWRRIYDVLYARRRPEPDDADALAAQQAYAAHFVKMQLAGQFAVSDGPALPGQTPFRPRHRALWYGMAAAALVALGGWWLFRDSVCKTCLDSPPKSEIATRKGSRSRISLPDGSLVWLNADSRISYPDNFKGSKREVYLTGEAYFDVARDATRPFLIHAGPVDIHVLGTSFDVRSYPLEKRVETLLLKGSIEVLLKNHKKILLQPNQKLSVPTDSGASKTAYAPKVSQAHPVAAAGDSNTVETMWVDNKLAFESETLDVVAGDIERWYNVEVRIQNEHLQTLRFTGVFEDQSLQDVMEALKLTGRFNYTIVGNKEVIIY